MITCGHTAQHGIAQCLGLGLARRLAGLRKQRTQLDGKPSPQGHEALRSALLQGGTTVAWPQQSGWPGQASAERLAHVLSAESLNSPRRHRLLSALLQARTPRLAKLAMGGLLFAQGRGLGGSRPLFGGRWELVQRRRSRSRRRGAGAGRAPWILGAPPQSLLFPLTSCFPFLLVLTAYRRLLPSPPARPGRRGRRLVFRSEGGAWAAVFPVQLGRRAAPGEVGADKDWVWDLSGKRSCEHRLTL